MGSSTNRLESLLNSEQPTAAVSREFLDLASVILIVSGLILLLRTRVLNVGRVPTFASLRANVCPRACHARASPSSISRSAAYGNDFQAWFVL